MKAVLDLTKAITDKNYYSEQFAETNELGSKPEKKILYVAPQLTSKHLYKFILPFFSFYNDKVFTAITGLTKYEPYEQIVKLDATLTNEEILWADYIVFPFTTDDLSKQYGLYEAIREVKPTCKIVFYVDFNYYLMPPDHPHKELFTFPTIIDSTERNILYADLCLTNNAMLRNFLHKHFTNLADDKFKDVENIPVRFANLTYLIDAGIVSENVDFELLKSAPVINRDIVNKVADVAEEIKKDDLSLNQDKAVKLADKKTTPKKVQVKTKKVVANKNKGKGKGKGKPVPAKGKKGAKDVEPIEPVVEPVVEIPAEANTEVKEEPKTQVVPLSKRFRIGIICSPNSHGDIKYYNEEFQKINERYGDNVTLIFIGYDYEKDKNKILDGVNFEYVKPVSIIHYFKQLQGLELDLVFIPIRRINFNLSSECINKYLEPSLFNVPVVVDDVYPYNNIILTQRNGFTYKDKATFIQELDLILGNPDLIKAVGLAARVDVLNNYCFTTKNIDVISMVYN